MGWNPGMQVFMGQVEENSAMEMKGNGEQFQSLCLLHSSGPLFFSL